jgi:hypothetical protein
MFAALLASSRSEAVPPPLGDRLQADERMGAVGHKLPIASDRFPIG